jgi:hypothetical protein
VLRALLSTVRRSIAAARGVARDRCAKTIGDMRHLVTEKH